MHPNRPRKEPASAAIFFLIFACSLAAATSGPATQPKGPLDVVNAMLTRIESLVEPAAPTAPKTFSARIRVTDAAGLPRELVGASVAVALQAPDRLKIAATWNDGSRAGAQQNLVLARDGQELWAHAPGKKFGVIAKAGVARFSVDPASIDNSTLQPLRISDSVTKARLALLLGKYEFAADEELGGAACQVIRMTIPESLRELLGVPDASVELAIRKIDQLPARIRYKDNKIALEAVVENPAFSDPIPAEQWKLHPADGDTIKTAALSHITRGLDAIQSTISRKIPKLGPASGQKVLVAASGKGRLEMHDGARVMFLKGTPEEMGRQHGELLKAEARDLMHRVLYGVGVGSSFVKGKWFLGEIEDAQKRLAPFVSDRTWREIDALADAAGVHRQEARLANVFPELFHCSGFAITGEATVGGRIYHGRVLDYLRGVGLEGNAVVTVYQPDEGHAWVNCGYAGFVGSVTAMNAKGISMGEMGGRGEGKWDGKPMAQLVREVMEKASTLEEAIDIMKKGPRTCEYYYVIADGKSKSAVGIAATPDRFEKVGLGEAHPQLRHAIKGCVLLSAGDRYEKLVERVKAGYGKFNDVSARALMERPVAMNSNIQSVLFAPDRLDFWVANADSKNVASHTRYTKYNLAELLQSAPAPRPRGLLNGLKRLLTDE